MIAGRAVFLLLALLALPCSADIIAGTWTNATTNEDGTPLPATGPQALASTRMEWGTCDGTAFLTLIGSASVNFTETRAETPDLPPALYCFRAFHINNAGMQSRSSTVRQFTVLEKAPGRPTAFRVIKVQPSP